MRADARAATTSRARLPRWLRALRVVHPFPTVMNALTAGGLGLIVTHGTAPLAALVHLMLAMLAIQASIGIVNDLVDYGLDAACRPEKPLVDGALSPAAARVAAGASLAAAAQLSRGFGVAAWLLAMAGLGCGLVYDLRLKRTWASGLPLVVALPLLPLWVLVALGRFRVGLLALVPLGCLLGLSLHLANSLVDFDGDAREGVRGLVHRLGKGRALAVCWGSFGLVLALIAASTAAVPYRLAVLLPGLATAALCLAAAASCYAWSPSRRSLQAGWGLLVCGSAALALSWLAALPPQ